MPHPDGGAVPRSVDHTFIMNWGLQFIAYTLDVALWGAAVVLALQYFRKYFKKDPVFIRIVVATLLIVTTIHAVSLAANDFQDLIVLFGDFEGQDVIPLEANVRHHFLFAQLH
ncbi:hypothetical protein B0H14DRAFT_3426421 [Mycena olivaceomarginata]|nr:hypothetical protein B0H14DRAFT_3426421 [Mycena olivaceomarginata]